MKENKEHLLKVLVLPEVPLNCYAAELVTRAKIRKKDANLQTITEERTKANDTFMTIVQTAKKLGVSTYQYICDRVRQYICDAIPVSTHHREKSSLSAK